MRLSPQDSRGNLVASNFRLLARGQVLERELSRLDFVLPHDQRPACTGFAGRLQRFLQAKPFITSGYDHSLAAKLAGQQSSVDVHARAQRSDVDVRRRRCNARGLLQGHHQPVFADGKTDARSGRSSQGFGKSVITAAAENGILRPQRAVGELERRAGVVIEPSHQAMIDNERHTQSRQDLLHFGKVHAAVFVEIVGHPGQSFDDGLIFGHLAVENAQRIGFITALAVGAHAADHVFERRAQSLKIFWPVTGIAYRVELQRPALYAEPVQQGSQHFEDFCVHGRRFTASGRWPNDFGADLEKLPVTPFLRTLAPKLRTNIVKALQARTFPQFVFNISADYARRVLRAQRQPLPFFALRAGPVFPREHLLGNNVGLFAHRALEELQVFDDGRADFLEVVNAKQLAHFRFDKVPRLRLRRQQIAGTANSLNHYANSPR